MPAHPSITYLSADSYAGEMNDMVIHRMVMAPILVVFGLGLVLSFGIEGDVQTGTEPSSFLVQDTGL